MSFLTVEIGGYLGNDAKVFQGETGEKFITFSVCKNVATGKDHLGNWLFEPQWFDIIYRPENFSVVQLLLKGTFVVVRGYGVRPKSYVNQKSQIQLSMEIKASSVDIVPSGVKKFAAEVLGWMNMELGNAADPGEILTRLATRLEQLAGAVAADQQSETEQNETSNEPDGQPSLNNPAEPDSSVGEQTHAEIEEQRQPA